MTPIALARDSWPAVPDGRGWPAPQRAGIHMAPAPQPQGLVLVSHTGSRAGRAMGQAGLDRLASGLGLGLPARAILTDRAGLRRVLAGLARERPEVVAVLGGDGTARTALEVLTPEGIPVLPLPGGTLNRLARRVHGPGQVGEVLLTAVRSGRPRWLSGARLGPHRFFVASGYGALMRLQQVRETLRSDGAGAALRRWASVSADLFGRQLSVGGLTGGLDAVVVSVGPLHRAFGLAQPIPRQDRQDGQDGQGGLQMAGARWDGWRDLLAFAPRVVTGHWAGDRRVICRNTDTVTLSTAVPDGGIDALLDGERVRLEAPARVEFDARAGLVWAV